MARRRSPAGRKVNRGALRRSTAATSALERAAPRRGVPGWVWVTGAAVVAGGGYYLWRRSQSQAPSFPLPMPVTPIRGTSTSALQPPPSSPGLPSGGSSSRTPSFTAPTDRLVSLLRSNATARQIYALQAAMYSCGVTAARPDGIYGPVTGGMIRQINQASGLGTSTAFSPTVLNLVPGALAVLTGNQNPTCDLIVPDVLPQDVIDAVNASALAVNAQFPLLQAGSSG